MEDSSDMEIEQDSEVDIKEILVYMEFDKKIKDNLFGQKIFFRMARLDGVPLIQLNNHIFKGEYKSCIGTNIFFSNHEKPQQENIFEIEGLIKLKHEATQMKMIDLKPVKIPSNLSELPQPPHDVKIKKRNEYKSLLKKMADGSLKFEDDLTIVPRETNCYSANDPEKHQEEKGNIHKKQRTKIERGRGTKMINNEKQLPGSFRSGVPVKKAKKIDVVDILAYKHEKLRRLAMIPTKRKKELEPPANCDEKYKKAYAYNSLKCTVIKPSDYFRTISEDFNEKTLVGAVDIDRSIIQGVIEDSPQYHRVLSEDEKIALMSIKNFENLSLAARYIVINSHLDHLKSTLSSDCESDSLQHDYYGRTKTETITIYKKLLRVLGGLVKHEYCYNSDVEDQT